MARVATLLHHTFGLRTIAPIIGSGFSAWVALGQMHMSIDDPEFWLLFFGGLACGLLSWGAIAYDGWKKEAESAKLSEQITDLLAAMDPRRPDLENLSTKTNAWLKRRADTLARQLIAFEANARQGQYRDHFYDRMLSEEENRAVFIKHQQEESERHDRVAAEFHKLYRSDGLAILEELRRRLGLMPPYAINSRAIAFDHGALAGPSPITDSAIVLQRLARELQD